MTILLFKNRQSSVLPYEKRNGFNKVWIKFRSSLRNIGNPEYAVYLPGRPLSTPSDVHARDIQRFLRKCNFS